MALVLGNHNATKRYGTLATDATTEFHRRFFNSSVQRYGSDLGAVQSREYHT